MLKSVFPISSSQQNIWRLEQSMPGTPINNICTTVRVNGRLDIPLLQKSLNLLIEADDSLRTRIVLEAGQPCQYYAAYTRRQFPFFDFTLTSRESFFNWEEAAACAIMPLIDQPLYEISIFKRAENDGGVLFKTHHLISDAWSQALLCNRLAAIYLELLGGGESVTEIAKGAFGRVESEEQYAASKACERDRRFWDDVMSRPVHPAVIKRNPGTETSPVGQRKSFVFSDLLNQQIYAFCQKNRVSPFVVIYMALAAYLARTGGSERFCIGVPVVGRAQTAEKLSTGMYVRTVPFVNEINTGWSFYEFVERLNENWMDVLKHQRFPFEEIAALGRKHHPDLQNLFQIVLSYQNGRITAHGDAAVEFSGRWHYSGAQKEQLCIHLSNMENERQYVISYDYLTQLFSGDEIEKLHACLANLLADGLTHPEKPVDKLSMLDNGEKEKVLFRFNRPHGGQYGQSVYRVWENALRKNASRAALIVDGKKLTYKELGAYASAYARKLIGLYPDGKATVALLLEKGFSLAAGMIGVAQAGCAWLVLPADFPRGRLEEMLENSGADVLISNTALLEKYGLLCEDVINADEVEPDPVGLHSYRLMEPEDIAYLVYTSGSTGKPKGVEIKQRSLLNYAAAMKDCYGHGAVLSLCHTGFDVFVLESVVSLLNGKTIVLPTEKEQESPAALALLIKNFGVGFFAITPSRLSAYLQNGEFAAALANVESVVCGGEGISGELVQLIGRHTNARVYNQYGPAETAIGVCMKQLNGAPAITAGVPMQNCRLYVLDQNRMPLPVGVEGEIYIGGVCVGNGYRNAPELTEQVFLDDPFIFGERIYKTGDMGSFTPNGEIVVAGRGDSLVKLRGQRVEPQETAARLKMHPDITEAAVRVTEQDGVTVLTAYYTSKKPVAQGDLLDFMATYLPAYMIPAHLVCMEAIPLTANGKVDFEKLPLPEAETHCVAPYGEVQERILNIFRRALGKNDVYADSDYFQCGGDSLSAVSVIAELEREFGVELRISDLYTSRNVLHLEKLLGARMAGGRQEIKKTAGRVGTFPLTPIQQSLYVQSRLDKTGLAYNMPGAFILPRGIDTERLREAFVALVRTEPLLRTRFVQEGARIVQQVEEQVDFAVEAVHAPDLRTASASFVKPFDLSRAPLIRAAVWEQEGRTVLFVDTHHIISDGIGSRILMERLDALYRGEEPEGGLNYLDYSLWRQQQGEEEPGYWQKALEGARPLDLPTDFKRPQAFDYAGGRHAFALSDELARRCGDYCAERDTSPFVLFAGVFGILLQKLSGAEDLLIGTPVSGRREKAHEDIFGAFIATLPLRVFPEKQSIARAYLDAVRQRAIDLLDHQYSRPEELAALAQRDHSLQQNTLYNVMFSMRPGDTEFSLGGNALEYVPVETNTAKLDLNLEAAKRGEGYDFYLEYASSLFERETIEFYSRCFLFILERVLENDAVALQEMDPLCPRDRRQLVEIPNRTCTPYLNMPIDMQIDEVVAGNPHKAAVLFHGESTSYGEIKRRADALAGFLQQKGVAHGDNVAFCLRRGPDNLTAMLGILKAGAAYVPMIDSLPQDRVRYMLENSQAKLLLCDEETRQKLPGDICPLENIVTEYVPYQPVPGRGGEDVMQILYTSGTTGRPKGVMLKTKSLCNLLPVMEGLLRDIDGNFLCITNAIFDTFITETLYQLALGRTIVMADEEEMMIPRKIAALIEKHDGGMIQFTPSRLQLCLADSAFFKAMERIGFTLVCGEVFPLPLLRKLEGTGDTRIVTMYGPTEVTVYMTQEDVTGWQRMVVGRPMPNCRVYALDDTGNPVMPTARGELYIAGECLSAGYIGREDLTEAAFLPDPFYGGLMYKTGDIARMRLDGNYEFCGRKDSQVKLNGQRIELGEITGQMLLYPAVGEAAAVVAKKEDGSAYLRGLVVFREGCAEDLEGLKAHLCQTLPAYMVPAKLEVLEEMPRTASGKTDVLLLASGADTVEKALPVQEAADGSIEAMWREVLEAEAVDPQRSFFDQGGTSLGAVTLIGMYFEKGWELTLEQFYNNPTLESQAALVAGIEQGIVVTEPVPTPVAEARHIAFAAQDSSPRSTVLLTGATGFLGMHLIEALHGEGMEKIICVGRGNSVFDYRERMRNNLEYYFGDRAERFAEVLELVEGDICQPGFGMPRAQMQEIAERVDYVLHAAADTRHYASDQSSIRTNCAGTANAVALARLANARLLHISTISVCGEYLQADPRKSAVFTEEEFDIGQNWEDNVYVKSKFLAEKLVFEAIEGGLDAKIFRIGRLVGRSRDGRFQKNPRNNTFYSIVRGILRLECYPASMAKTPIELSAVDDCARAVALLRDGNRAVYHVFNPNTLPLSDLVRAIHQSARQEEDHAFDAYLKDRMGSDLARLAVLLETRNRMKQKPQRIEPSAKYTASELLGRDFVWKQPDAAMLLREFAEGGHIGNT